MDNGLVHGNSVQFTMVGGGCLNPCCSGQWSSTSSAIKGVADGIVLILVVVDNGLVQSINERRTLLIKS